MKYLLPCDQCGREHEVDRSRAGDSLQCECGHVLEVPSLRGLRELKPVSVESPRAAPSRPATELPRRLILVGGMLLAAIGVMVAAYGGLNRAQIRIPQPPPTEDAQADASIDALNPAETHLIWTQFRDEGLGPYVVPNSFLAELVQDHYSNLLFGGLILTGVGILLIAGVAFMPSGQRRTGNGKKPD